MERLGIDIDGVLNNFSGVLKVILQRDFDFIPDDSQYYMLNELKFSKSQLLDFWIKYSPQILNMMSPEQDAVNVLTKLSNEYDINIITARDTAVIDITTEWIDKWGIPYDNIYFNSGDKVDKCKELDAIMMIEDNPHNVKALNDAGVNTLLFDRPYNRRYNDSVRVTNWNEIYDIMK